MKPLVWVATTLGDLRDFPLDARKEAGYQLFKVQAGDEPTDWKPMPAVGPGVREIRVHAGGEYRVLYAAKFEEAVYVLHVFIGYCLPSKVSEEGGLAHPDQVCPQYCCGRRSW